MKIQEKVYGNYDDFSILDASKDKGAFSPFYLETTNHFRDEVHNIEAFGPVSTLIRKNMDEAIELVELGKGSLVTSFVILTINYLKILLLMRCEW